MVDRVKASVVIAIFVRQDDDTSSLKRCAFYDTNDKIYLPNELVTAQEHAPQIAARMIRRLVPIDPRIYTVIPIGFFDPIIEDVTQRPDREILLAYKVVVSPQMPVLSELVWKDYEELGIASSRISQGHFRIFRAGMY